MIDAGIDVNESWFGRNALTAAAENGHSETVSMLVHAGADVNHTGGEQSNVLLQAINEENEAMVQLLIEAGANMSCRSNDFFDFTPLQFAASRGARTIVGMLLAASAAVNREARNPLIYNRADEGKERPPDELPTPLCLAASNNHVEIANMLIDAGANVNADGGAVLAAAAKSGNDEIVHLSIRHGAAVELPHKGGSPLYWAAFRGKLSTVSILIEAGAFVDRVFETLPRPTAILAAQNRGHDEVVQLLHTNEATL